ncbi:hypothetical protein PR202_gb19415 [Eleusine coracana subsp. coracana]|uniref:Uncharacterized protein n=1 Tax=Eleusine coracana subsp. coracana TaxID=191504 RepID=A0AAV5F875_ELECO|nr:hypothetical protein PR202_gb19415 [Eleusine coracana subsp. coracana]
MNPRLLPILIRRATTLQNLLAETPINSPSSKAIRLVHLLNLGPGTAATAAVGRTTAWHVLVHARGTRAALVHLGDDGVADSLELLHLVLELLRLGELVPVEPLDCVLDAVLDPLLVLGGQLGRDLFVLDGVAHVVCVVLQRVARLHLALHLLVLGLVLLGLLHHLLDLLLAEPSLVVGDGDLVLLPGGLVLRRHVQDAVGVDVEGDVDLRHASGSRRDARELELAQQVVILGPRPLALVHLDQHARLVVRVGGEHLLLLGRDGGVPRDERRHHAAGSLQPQRQRRDVEQKQVLHLLVALAAEDGGLHGGAVRHGLVRVDALAELLAVEEVLEELLHFGDPGGPAHQHDVLDRRLVQLGVAEALLHGLHALPEQVHVQLLEPGPGDGRVKVDPLVQRIDLDGGLRGGGERPLGPLTRRPQPPERPRVATDILLVLPLELLHEVVHQPVVEVLASQVGVTGRGLDLKDALLDGEDGHIEGTATKIKYEHVLLARAGGLLVEPVGDGSSGGLIDDAHDVEPGDEAGVLGGLPLGVVEVGRHGDDRVLDGGAQEGLRDLLHLGQHHGGDLLRRELLLLALVGHHDHGLVSGARDHLERPHLHVRLHGRVRVAPPDQTLRICIAKKTVWLGTDYSCIIAKTFFLCYTELN